MIDTIGVGDKVIVIRCDSQPSYVGAVGTVVRVFPDYYRVDNGEGDYRWFYFYELRLFSNK